MDWGVLIPIVIAVVTGIALLIWFASRRSPTKCAQCGHPLGPGQSECPFCHTPVRRERTFIQRFPTARLACIGGPRVGEELALKGRQVQIGRSPECDIRLDDDLVSWKHALLTFDNGQYMLYDQDSTNGTWVNGQRIAQCVIRPGVDQIQIGPSIFVLKIAGQPIPTPPLLPIVTPPQAPVERVYDFGDYERVATLGSGGAAIVYKAISRHDRQVVAVKVLQQFDPYLRKKFQKEMEIGVLLHHPHIVRIYGGGESQGVFYIVMEYMDGGTLRDRMYPGQSLASDQVITIVGQVCDALQYAHRMGVYHRDIKPENIFFSSDGQVKLGDFGIARLAQSVTRTASGWLIGTPPYMSYEQAKGHPIDGRSDLYSLGVVLYEMVTGRCPFMADNPLAIVDKHIMERPIPPSRINPGVPHHIESVIMRALEKDRNRRFRTAEEMARALGYTAPMYGGEAALVPAMAPMPAATPPYQPVPAATSPPQPLASLAMPGALRLVRVADGVVIPLRPGTTPLNRRDVNSGDLEISRTHARVVQRGGYYWIEDMGSSNGTFVNGLRIFSPQVLRPGDQIRLGRTVLQVEG